MRCWFHDWSLWSETYARNDYWGNIKLYQKRTCMRCKIAEERML